MILLRVLLLLDRRELSCNIGARMIIFFLISFYTFRLLLRRCYLRVDTGRRFRCVHLASVTVREPRRYAQRDDNEISRKCIIYGLTSLRMHLATSQQPLVHIERMLDIDFIRNDAVAIFYC